MADRRPRQEDFHFCGHDSLDNLPYCEYHAGVAYQAPEPRRRLRRSARLHQQSLFLPKKGVTKWRGESPAFFV